jgi:hypothetical protein
LKEFSAQALLAGRGLVNQFILFVEIVSDGLTKLQRILSPAARQKLLQGKRPGKEPAQKQIPFAGQ